MFIMCILNPLKYYTNPLIITKWFGELNKNSKFKKLV